MESGGRAKTGSELKQIQLYFRSEEHTSELQSP